MMASLKSLKGELWLVDQSRPPLGLSIMFLRIQWVSSSMSATATKAQSSMNPVKSSSFTFCYVNRSAL